MSERRPWALGKTSPKKVIHRADCRYARAPYNWAGQLSERELYEALASSQGISWHDAGRCCSENLHAAIYLATRKKRNQPVLDSVVAKLAAASTEGKQT